MVNSIHKKCTGLLVLPALCLAANFGGEWGSALYVVKDRIDTVRPLVTGFENVNLHVINVGGSNLSLFTNLNATNGFTDSLHKKVEISHLYLNWKQIGGRVDARLGRQAVYEGFRVKNFDGANINAALSKNITLSGFGGITVPSRYSKSYFQMNKDTSRYAAGIKAAARLGSTDIALSMEEDLGSGNSSRSGVGLDFAQAIGKAVSLRAMGVYGITGAALENYQLLLDVEPSEAVALQASLYSNSEEPDTSSLIARNVFDKKYQQITGSGTWFCCKNASIGAAYTGRFFEGGDANSEISLRVDHPSFSAGLLQDFGYGGTNTEVDASLRFMSDKPLQVEIGGDFSIIKIDSVMKSAAQVWVGRGALLFRPATSLFNAKLEVQQLHNLDYKSDTRILLTTQIRFSKFTAQ